MNEPVKIKDVSSRYGITARTLRYYEDIGLISSTRSEGHSRLYDETAITRIKQILILRKLGISIKDIKHVFAAPDSEAVLEVLGKKAEDIDDEVALLHELKGIIMDFIGQIKNADFHNNDHVKLLYDKAREIEVQLTTSDYSGNPGSASRLMEVTQQLEDKRITPPVAIKAYKETVGPMRFIGKKYASGGEAWQNLCEVDTPQLKHLAANLKGEYQDHDAIIGLMTYRHWINKDYGDFEYWLGYFTPENTPVPEGYEHEDFPASDIGIGWLYGKSDEVYGVESLAFEKLKEEGFAVVGGEYWWFERYHPVRCMEDKKGNVIIDICFFIKSDD